MYSLLHHSLHSFSFFVCARIYRNMDRDDANIKHFKSRSQQPKLLTGGGHIDADQAASPTVHIMFACDSEFGHMSDEIESLRFRYMGVPPDITTYNKCCARRANQAFMASSFKY